MENGPEEILTAALLAMDGYPLEGLSDQEISDILVQHKSRAPEIIARAEAEIEKTNRDLEERANAMTTAIKQYFEAKMEEAQNGTGE